MEHDSFKIEIDGEEMTDLYPDLISLEVELDNDLAGMFRLHLNMPQQADGSWSHVDDERLAAWKEVIISAGFESGTEALITGYITHVKPLFTPEPENCTLEIWGMDGSVLMDREDKLKAWPDKKDSDIAQEIFGLYGFTPEVEDTEVIHDEKVSTIIQRETDIQFLKRLARRNGYECYIEGDVGVFKPPQVDAAQQPVLAAHFGDETNLTRFSIEVNALASVNVAMFQIDRANKEVLDVQVERSEQKGLGGVDAPSLLPVGIDPGLVVVGRSATTGNPEMTALCQGLYHQGEWFVTGEGEVAANDYGHVLKPRGTVTIKGVGEAHSGVYYLAHVTHSFTPTGYIQHFRAMRNGLKPTGAENFSASAGLLGGLL